VSLEKFEQRPGVRRKALRQTQGMTTRVRRVPGALVRLMTKDGFRRMCRESGRRPTTLAGLVCGDVREEVGNLDKERLLCDAHSQSLNDKERWTQKTWATSRKARDQALPKSLPLRWARKPPLMSLGSCRSLSSDVYG